MPAETWMTLKRDMRSTKVREKQCVLYVLIYKDLLKVQTEPWGQAVDGCVLRVAHWQWQEERASQ